MSSLTGEWAPSYGTAPGGPKISKDHRARQDYGLWYIVDREDYIIIDGGVGTIRNHGLPPQGRTARQLQNTTAGGGGLYATDLWRILIDREVSPTRNHGLPQKGGRTTRKYSRKTTAGVI